MIIKITTIGSAHGGNAINYAMNKDKKMNGGEVKLQQCEQPFILAAHGIYTENIITGEPDANDVWMSMKYQQAKSNHRIKDGFFRVEIAPSKDECQGWSAKDWRKLLDDAIRHLDALDYTNKSGKVVGKHTDFEHSQWVAAIHRDTDNWHIHLIVNRITMNDELQDANKIRERGIMAANNLAIERGWVRAQDKKSKRKSVIHADAIAVLRDMKNFDLSEYFRQMKAKGWLVDAKYDSKGICRGYSIGEELSKKSGGNSSIVMYQSSKLGFGRDLMVSHLQKTWKKLHVVNVEQKNNTHKNDVLNTMASNVDVVTQQPTSMTKTVVSTVEPIRMPEWPCSSYKGKEQWNAERESNYRIPDEAYRMIDDLIKPLDGIDYYNADNDIPGKAAMVAVAVFEFASAANVSPTSGGGGGESQSDLRWDGKTKDDFEKMASMAVRKAVGRCTSHLYKRGRGRGR